MKPFNILEKNYLHSFIAAMFVAIGSSLADINTSWITYIALAIFSIMLIYLLFFDKNIKNRKLYADIAIGFFGSAIAIFLGKDIDNPSNLTGIDNPNNLMILYLCLGFVFMIFCYKSKSSLRR